MSCAWQNAIKACCAGSTCSSCFLWEGIESQWIARWNSNGFIKWDPSQFCLTIFKASLSDFTALTERLPQSRRKCVFGSFLAHTAPGFIKLLHSISVLKDVCVTWIPSRRVTLDPLMSRQLNYLLQPLFLPKRFKLRLGHTPLELFFETEWRASWRIQTCTSINAQSSPASAVDNWITLLKFSHLCTTTWISKNWRVLLNLI